MLKLKKDKPMEPVTVAVLADPKAPVADDSARRSLATAIDEHVALKLSQTTRAQADQYRQQLGDFFRSAKLAYLDQVTEKVFVRYIERLVGEGKSPTTVDNRFTSLKSLLLENKVMLDYKSVKKHLPPIPKSMPRVYSEATLKQLFAAAGPEEKIKFHFFLALGMRERKVMHSAYTDIDWKRQTYTVQGKADVGFSIKNHEDRILTVPTALLVDLKERQKARPNDRWLFPTPTGRLNGHLLRDLQELAHRAGMNCGKCVTKKAGKSCQDFACCRMFNLHDFRRTFATRVSPGNPTPA